MIVKGVKQHLSMRPAIEEVTDLIFDRVTEPRLGNVQMRRKKSGFAMVFVFDHIPPCQNRTGLLVFMAFRVLSINASNES
jgi:hypothetical protein